MDIFTLVSTFIFQIGSRHVVFDLTDTQKKLVQHPATQAMLLFIMFYMTTRSVYYASIMLIGFYLVMHVWINEKSAYNLLPKAWYRSLDAARDDPTRLYYENMAKLP